MYPLHQTLRHFVLSSSKKSISRRLFCDGANLQSQFKYGQPTEWTHPHIIQKNEVNKGIHKDEFKIRREKLIEKLLQLKNKGKHLLVLPAAKRKYMVDKIPYFYRQDTDFRYLTGCLQPDNVLVIEFSNDGLKSVIFCKESSAYDEKWEGPRLGYSEAVQFLGIDEAAPLKSLEGYLYNSAVENTNINIWYDYMQPTNTDTHEILMDIIRETKRINSLESPRQSLHQLRVIKSPAEVELMRESCRIGSEALATTIKRSSKLETEGQVLASLEHETRLAGACHLAYPPVIASGNNATIIHYIAASSRLLHTELLLVDAGCEYHGYSSDITRTWPPAGAWTEPQLCLYQAVLDTQLSLISNIRPGITTVDSLYRDMQVVLGKHLQQLGLIEAGAEYLSARTHDFCPHHVSHYLGMDVHDCSKESKTQPLTPGMVITLEPGCYIPQGKDNVDPRWWGLGCRIEDDILITESGVEVLSSGCPKHVEDIKKLFT